MEDNICYIPVSIGELFDKYTILQIKQTRIKDQKKIAIVEKELSYLKEFIDKYNLEETIVHELKEINETLWTIEDKIREKEKEHKFDEEFVKLARNVYITNDKRCETKNKINTILKSGLQEVKSYSKYTNDNNNEIINIGINNPNPKPKTKSQQIEELNKQNEKLSNTFNYNELVNNYNKIIDLDPQNRNKYLQKIGEIYEKQTNFEKAIEYYEKVLKNEKYDISTIGVLSNQVGVCYHNLKKYELAISYFKKVLLIKEINDVYCNIATCYVAMKNYKEAEFFLLKSYKLNNNDIKTNNSLGNIYYYIKKYDKSIEYYTKNKNNEDNYEHKYNLSFAYLAGKKFKQGYTLYENRLKANNINKQTGVKERVDIPGLQYWNGKDICNRLLIVYEQGIGDNIQYYRFIIELSEKYPNMKIDYFCKKGISYLFNTYNNIQIIENVNIPDYDYTIFIMSLPKILDLKTIEPNKVNYIKTNEEKLLFWKRKTSSLKRFKVGVVYNGLLSSFIEKYIPLQEYEKLCDLNIDLICIHRKSEVENDLKNINFRDKIIHYSIDKDVPFEDTIHLLQNIDLLITVDTYIVHLAGILNVKTWLLLGTSEWRWSDDKNKTYWYDSVELIRTKEKEELKDLIKTVKTKLIEVLKTYTPSIDIDLQENTMADELDEERTGLNDLDLGWCQGYMGLKYHMEEALIESNLNPLTANPYTPIALFSKKYYNDINELNHNKKYDYCFIGSINSCYERRRWVIDFAKKNFTINSIFINTDDNLNWELLGAFDYSKLKLGFCPKSNHDPESKAVQYRVVKENIYYFETMCQSKFILCPAGDSSWSFRFYETLMCKSIPIVESWHHTYRTKEEANIKYNYVLFNDTEKDILYDDYVNENTIIFENNHLINYK
uniref:Uncharacterized protein n=1 Tax=viral metagenome TaxID=1070528 RepID=A0A6C0IK29_9ZZZZ